MPRQRLLLTVAVLRTVPRRLTPVVSDWWQRVLAEAKATLPDPEAHDFHERRRPGGGLPAPSSPPPGAGESDWYDTLSGRSGPPAHWVEKVLAGAPHLLEPETGTTRPLARPNFTTSFDAPERARTAGPDSISAAAAPVAVPSPPPRHLPESHPVDATRLPAGAGRTADPAGTPLAHHEPAPRHRHGDAEGGAAIRWLRQATVRLLHITTDDLPGATAEPLHRRSPVQSMEDHGAPDRHRQPIDAGTDGDWAAAVAGEGPPFGPQASTGRFGRGATAPAPEPMPAPWADHPSARSAAAMAAAAAAAAGDRSTTADSSRAANERATTTDAVGAWPDAATPRGSARRAGAHLTLAVPGVTSPLHQKPTAPRPAGEHAFPDLPVRAFDAGATSHESDSGRDGALADHTSADPWPPLPHLSRPEQQPTAAYEDVVRVTALDAEQRSR